MNDQIKEQVYPFTILVCKLTHWKEGDSDWILLVWELLQKP